MVNTLVWVARHGPFTRGGGEVMSIALGFTESSKQSQSPHMKSKEMTCPFIYWA